MNDRRFEGDFDRLRSPERLARLEIERVTAACVEGLPVSAMVDVGAGSGVFSEAFAAQGFRVIGVDVNPAAQTIFERFVPGSRFLSAAAEKLPLQDDEVDLAFLGHVLHETDVPLHALQEARRVARLRTAVLEWKYQVEDFGPPLEHRLKAEQVAGWAAAAGFLQIDIEPLEYMVLYLLQG